MTESFDIANVLGCYVYLIRGHDDEVLYVGKSTNIMYRIGQHIANGLLSDPEKLYEAATVEKIRCSSPSAMARVESKLIELHTPLWNINGIVATALPGATGIAAACQWLTDYLRAYGSTPSSQVREAAASNNVSVGCLRRAVKKIGVVVSSKSYPGRPHTTIWKLPTIRDLPEADQAR